MEWLRLELRGQYGITEDLEIALTIPFHHTNSGFMDDFVNDFHDLTGLGPSDRPTNNYEDDLSFRGEQILSFPEESLQIADVPVSLKYAWLRDGRDPLGVSFRVGIELPTGDRTDGAGNGAVDGGIGLIVEKSVGDFSFFTSLDAAFQQTPSHFRAAGVDVDPVVPAAALAAEWRALDWLAVVGQLNFAGRLIPGADIPQLQRPRLFWTIGVHAQVSDHVALRIGMVEDAITGSSPDVVFFFGCSVHN
jgi:hypothetical protein